MQGSQEGSACGKEAMFKYAFSCGLALAVMMVAGKLWSITLTFRQAQGNQFGDLGLVRVLAWFAQDLVFGMATGFLLGVPLCLLSRRARSQVWRWAIVALHLVLLVAIALALSLGCHVHFLFGVAPTYAFSQELGGTPGQATDSVRALFDASFVLSWFLFALTGGIAFTIARRLLKARRSKKIFIVLVPALLFFVLFATLPKRDRLDLDRNSIYSFLWTSVLRPSAAPFGSDLDGADLVLADLLSPISEDNHELPAAEVGALQSWIANMREAGETPNIVLVILESTAKNYLQLTGGEHPNTPNLARYAKQGWLWTHHYSHIPLSTPAIYSILCSAFGVPFSELITEVSPRVNCNSLPEVLSTLGYESGLFHSGRFSFGKKDRFLRNRGYSVLLDATTMPERENFHESSWGIAEEATVGALLRWVSEQRGPYFATYIPVVPHHPYETPPGTPRAFPLKGTKGHYVNAVHYVDSVVGRMVEELGKDSNTLFVFLGDHGEGFGEHAGSFMHGANLFEEGTRSFVLWYPSQGMTEGTVLSTPTGHADILPTLLDLLQHPASSGSYYDGQSQVPERTRRMIPLLTNRAHKFIGFRDGKWKFIYDRNSLSYQLFDLETDPAEQNNLADNFPRLCIQYWHRARDLMAFTSAKLKAQSQSIPALDEALAVEKVEWKAGAEELWEVDLASCQIPANIVLTAEGDLEPRGTQAPTVRCTLPLPAGRAKILGFDLDGEDNIGGAWVEGSLQFAGDRFSRALGNCQINQKENCSAELGAEISGPGTLEFDLRFVMFHGLPRDRSHYRIRGGRVRYVRQADRK